MESGYLSRDAIKDLLAVRNGEIDYLRSRVEYLESENEQLNRRITSLNELLTK